MKYSLRICIFAAMIAHVSLASDNSDNDQIQNITRGFDLQSLRYCQADYTVEATSYTKQPLAQAILHLNEFYQNPSGNNMRVTKMRIRCKRGRIPFKTSVVTTDKPLLLEYAISIMNSIKKNEVAE